MSDSVSRDEDGGGEPARGKHAEVTIVCGSWGRGLVVVTETPFKSNDRSNLSGRGVWRHRGSNSSGKLGVIPEAGSQWLSRLSIFIRLFLVFSCVKQYHKNIP